MKKKNTILILFLFLITIFIIDTLFGNYIKQTFIQESKFKLDSEGTLTITEPCNREKTKGCILGSNILFSDDIPLFFSFN